LTLLSITLNIVSLIPAGKNVCKTTEEYTQSLAISN